MLVRWCALALSAVLAVAGPVSAAKAQGGFDIREASLMTLGGYYHVTNGFSRRLFGSVYGDVAFNNGLGIQAEATYLNREQNLGYFGAGVSYDILQEFTVRVGGGTSTNGSIMPSWRLHAGFDYRFTDLTVSPLVYRSQFRDDHVETGLEIQIAKYFSITDSHFLVVQAVPKILVSTPGSHWGPSLLVAVTVGTYRAWSASVAVEGGRMAYDSVLRTPVTSGFVTVRPGASYNVTPNIELIVRGEYSHNNFYDIIGGFGGVKFLF
jgi:YaiO family outer membrane protein